MPKQKDLKRLVRSRMEKTGEAYTTARLYLVKNNKKEQTVADFAAVAGMSDASVNKATGRTWEQWVKLLDASGAKEKPHRDIARTIGSLGTPSWWSQTVAVGYERIRGLRDKGQRRDGGYMASKSRTFNVPVETLYEAFANARKRGRWLPAKIKVLSSSPNKRLRVSLDDGTTLLVGFISKGASKSSVAIEHQNLPSKAAATAMKQTWSEHFDRLGKILV